jgi:phosphoribosylformylglycinamidine synthase PurS subunit
MMKATVTVSLKPSVLDAQGKAIEHALHQMGFEETANIRVNKSITFSLNATDKAAAEARVKQMCERLLANTVIETYAITIE